MREASANFDPTESISKPFDAALAEHPIDRMLHSDSFVRLPDHPVMITDRMTMAHSLEARSPFMDHELAQFAARLPMNLKVRGRSLRYIQKRLAERYLPDSVLNRPKQGFASALPYLLRNEYENLFDVFLQRSTLAEAGLLDQSGIDSVLAEHRSERFDHGNRLWLLVNAEAWYRLHFGGQGRDGLRAVMQRSQSDCASLAA
jgi:asparagine synthase (glutamine-hydrolysing)